LQQGFDDEAAKLAGGAGDDDHDASSFKDGVGAGRIMSILTFCKYAPKGKCQ
jgi:hypothetical protein